MEFFHKLQSALSTFEPELSLVAQARAGSPDLFVQTMKAALIRSYEFTCKVTAVDDEIAFFMMPFLRGVCEDYIVLKFFYLKLGDGTDEAIGIKIEEDLYRSAIAQWNFFEANRPDQDLYYQEEFRTKDLAAREQLRNLLLHKGIQPSGKKNPLPSVHSMAAKSNLSELYDYVYHATSSFVHFNPRVLLRMGWGKLPNVTFSTKNFGKYYKHFACFYGAYLFLQLCTWAVELGLVKNAIETGLNKVSELLQDEPHWPELVTFEEMNIGGLSRVLFYKSPSRVKTEKK
jgi:Family of unknown function (DUF5677)